MNEDCQQALNSRRGEAGGEGRGASTKGRDGTGPARKKVLLLKMVILVASGVCCGKRGPSTALLVRSKGDGCEEEEEVVG